MDRTVDNEKHILRDLGNGLVLRRAVAADTDALVAFMGDVFREPDQQGPNEAAAVWVRDLMERHHPTVNVGDFTVVEDTRTGRIASSLCLISQTWSYGGIPFGVGRPEAVATHPDYRRRGLVRAQFEVVHAWSAERGHKMTVLTGIPWFYRQFGYEMALSLTGGRGGYVQNVPKLKDGQAEAYRVRPATEHDVPFIAQVYGEAVKRYLVACVRDEQIWRYELLGRSQKNDDRVELRIVEAADGEPVGFLAHVPLLWGQTLATVFYELKPGVSWSSVTPGVLRYLQTTGQEYAAQAHKELEGFGFYLEAEHPLYRAIPERLPRTIWPYAWYVRVPDLADLIRHVAPVLERRLAESVLAGYTGQLRLSFFQDGLRLVFERGHLQATEPWQPTTISERWVPASDEGRQAEFPNLTFLQLLFGYRTLEELMHAFPDCWAEPDEARVLLQVLFPRQPSLVWGLA